jgi:hypothetical protein
LDLSSMYERKHATFTIKTPGHWCLYTDVHQCTCHNSQAMEITQMP